MGYRTKVQCIKRQNSEQWYSNFPAALAQAMDFSQSENVEWLVSDKRHLILHRPEAPADPIQTKKTLLPPRRNSEQPGQSGSGRWRRATLVSSGPPYLKPIGLCGKAYSD